MKFHFTFEALKSSTFQQANYTYSMAQIRMNLTRTDKSRQKIFAGYGNTGYEVSSPGIQIKKGVCLRTNIPKGYY